MAFANTVSVSLTSETAPPPSSPTRVRPPPLDTVRVGPNPRGGSSSHPTCRPDADLALLAEAGRDFRTPAFVDGECSPPMNVPVRTGGAETANISHRAAFVLMHVDGITEIITIAKLVGLPLAAVEETFDELIDAGLVELTVPEPASPGTSGVFLALPRRPGDSEF